MSGKRARPGPGTGIVVPASGRFDRRAFMQGSTALATALLFTGFDLRPARANPKVWNRRPSHQPTNPRRSGDER